MFYLLARTHLEQDNLLVKLKENGVLAVFHYVPLHNSEAGKKFGRVGSTMLMTEELSSRLVRLPIYPSLKEEEIGKVCNTVIGMFN